MEEETLIVGSAREFPETRWSIVRSARQDAPTRRAALEELLTKYWKPLYFYVRRKGNSVEAAKDSVQGFCVHLLERDFFAKPDPARGRFRAYLRVAMDNYLRGEHERQSAQKRGGGVKTLSLDFEVAERALGDTTEAADAAYDREWAVGVMERGIERLEDEFKQGVRRGPFEAVVRYFRFAERLPYEETARRHNMTVSQFKAFLYRTRKRFRDLVREEVSQSLVDAASADEEIDALIRALQS